MASRTKVENNLCEHKCKTDGHCTLYDTIECPEFSVEHEFAELVWGGGENNLQEGCEGCGITIFYQPPPESKTKRGKRRGLPLKYKDTHPQELRKEVSTQPYFGATISEIADLFQVTRKVIYEWIEKYPDFGSAVEEARQRVDERVENALLKNALGYEYDEKRIIRDGIKKDAKVLSASINKKHKPGNIAAQKLWLSLRQAKQWGEKGNVNAYEDVNVVFVDDIPEIEEVTEDENIS